MCCWMQSAVWSCVTLAWPVPCASCVRTSPARRSLSTWPRAGTEPPRSCWPPTSEWGDGSLAVHHHSQFFLSESLQSFNFQCHQMQCHVSSLFSQYTIKLLQHKNLLWTCTCSSYVLRVSVYIHEQLICSSPFLHSDLFLLSYTHSFTKSAWELSPLFQIEAVFFDRPSQNIP